MILQLLTALCYSVIFLGIFTLAEVVRRAFPGRKELSRKTAHVFCGLTALSFPYFIQSHWVVLGLVVAFSLLMLISKRKRLLQSIHEVGRRSYGSFYYPTAIYLIFLLASQKPAIYLISILALTLSDALSALIGQRYGTIRYEVGGNTKSLEGSIIFLLASFLSVLLPLLLMTEIGRASAVLIALVIATLLTGFEAISPTGSDNLIVPFGTYFLLSKMTVLPFALIVQDVYVLLSVVALTGFLSILKPGGLIGLVLINYAAITLGDIYWLIPILLTELLFYLFMMLRRKRPREKYCLRIIASMGIVPMGFIFLENTFSPNALIFIPYLVAIAGQLPISHLFAKFGKGQPLLAILAILLVAIPSTILFFGTLRLAALSVVIVSVLIVYLLNYLIHKLADGRKEYHLRLLSTALGSTTALFLTYYQGLNYV